MIQSTSSSRESQEARLNEKTRDAQLQQMAVEGAGLSPWEARTLLEIVKEVYLSDPQTKPLQCGQMRYTCIAAEEGAGKTLEECRKITVVLTVFGDEEKGKEDPDQSHHSSIRHRRITRMTEEARDQGGLLSQEDLAELLMTDARTIRRDIKRLREKYGISVPTRGQQKDIGAGVSHRTLAIQYWLEGSEPVEVSQKINHTVKAVERYIQQFCRIAYLHEQGFHPLQSAMTVGISSSSVNASLELLQKFRNRACFKQRMEEIQIQGASHYLAEDQEKGGPLQSVNSKEGGKKQ